MRVCTRGRGGLSGGGRRGGGVYRSAGEGGKEAGRCFHSLCVFVHERGWIGVCPVTAVSAPRGRYGVDRRCPDRGRVMDGPSRCNSGVSFSGVIFRCSWGLTCSKDPSIVPVR